MGLIRIDHNPSRLQLSVFGVLWLLFFTIVAILVYNRVGAQPATVGIVVAAVIVPFIGWVLPSFMRIVYLGMAYLAFPIGLIVSHLLLLFAYYLVLTPTGLMMRLFRYDPMKRRFNPQTKSYWVPRKNADSVDRYFRQV